MKYTILENYVEFVRNGANIKQLKTCNTGIPITRIETLSNGIFYPRVKGIFESVTERARRIHFPQDLCEVYVAYRRKNVRVARFEMV